MADETEKAEEAQNPETQEVSSKRNTLIAVGVSLAIVGTGAPLGYFIMKPQVVTEESAETAAPPVVPDISHDDSDHSEVVEDVTETYLEGEEALGAIVPFDTFLVNLAGGKYLRLQVQVEMETPDIPRRLYSHIVPIQDGIITMLTQKTASELEDVAGKDELKKSIRDLIHKQLHRQDVRRVYFTQFVIQ